MGASNSERDGFHAARRLLFTTIRANVNAMCVLRIGLIQRFTVMLQKVYILRIGEVLKVIGI
ncbi:hypothetical protein CCP3SC1_270017 [Gammaproteobacteria bacterium]